MNAYLDFLSFVRSMPETYTAIFMPTRIASQS